MLIIAFEVIMHIFFSIFSLLLTLLTQNDTIFLDGYSCYVYLYQTFIEKITFPFRLKKLRSIKEKKIHTYSLSI